ncbi:MAG: acyl-CoA thioesterase [Asticcacaulis sp.]
MITRALEKPVRTSLIDLVFPGDTNHHGTLFGGTALAHMDKVAFITAARHGHVGFVTASCERIDFKAPVFLGQLTEAVGTVERVGRTSMGVRVELYAEDLLSGERHLCTQGQFNMVAIRPKDQPDYVLPPLPEVTEEPADAGPPVLRMVELVLPGMTNATKTLYGGHALSMMGKAATIAASRHCRAAVLMASSRQMDFDGPIHEGEAAELVARVRQVGRSSMTIQVELWGEALLSGARRRCAEGEFVMVAVDDANRPVKVPPLYP